MAVESSKMTRNQVHQKLKENFQALCTRCPQLTDRKDSLDDSLTNLQWLWNLNVNIANPVDGGSKGGNQEVYRNGTSNGLKRQEHRPHKSIGNRPRQGKLSTSTKGNSSFRSTAPIAGQHKYITTVNVSPSGIGSPSKPNGGLKYRKQADIVKTSPHKNEDDKASIFLNKPNPTGSMDEFEFEEKPDISKINFQTSKADSTYPLLSDASFYPSASTPAHNNSKVSSSSMTSFNEGDGDLKSLYSIPVLITLALQHSPNGRMCLSSICQWIRENCDLYRSSTDLSWQKNVEKTLKQNESFVKVPKKKSHTRKTQWEVAQNINQSTEDYLGGLPFTKIRGLSSLSFNSPANRGLFGSGLNGSATTTAMNLLNRKRKQTMPQKIVRLRTQHKRRRQNNTNSNDLSTLLDQLDDSNPLRDQAPEVGSLKGDFNWTTIFDDFSSDNLLNESNNTGTSRCSNSPLVSPNPLSDSASSFFNLAFGTLASGRLQANRSLATSEASLSPTGSNNENLNMFAQSEEFGSTSSYGIDNSQTQDDMEKLLNGESLFQSITDINGDDVIIDGFVNDGSVESISIDEFFQGTTTGLDLTVQGHQITAPPHWAPVGNDLETILCESQDSNLSPTNSSPGASR